MYIYIFSILWLTLQKYHEVRHAKVSKQSVKVEKVFTKWNFHLLISHPPVQRFPVWQQMDSFISLLNHQSCLWSKWTTVFSWNVFEAELFLQSPFTLTWSQRCLKTNTNELWPCYHLCTRTGKLQSSYCCLLLLWFSGIPDTVT